MTILSCKSWGIDLSNVILKNLSYENRIKFAEKNTDISTIANHVNLIPDALIAVRFLVHQVGKDNVWILSKSLDKEIDVNLNVLDRYKFYNITGLDRQQVLFIPHDADKLPVIKSLQLEGFIEDKGFIINHIQHYVKFPIWFAPTDIESALWTTTLFPNVRVVARWKQFMEIF